jgi:hypothetical protein
MSHAAGWRDPGNGSDAVDVLFKSAGKADNQHAQHLSQALAIQKWFAGCAY